MISYVEAGIEKSYESDVLGAGAEEGEMDIAGPEHSLGASIACSLDMPQI